MLKSFAGGPEEGRWVRCGCCGEWCDQCSANVVRFDATRHLDILRHDREALRVDGDVLYVVEKLNNVAFGGHLQKRRF